MIVTNDFEVRVGARTLLDAPGQHLRVQPGDRIGLVGRNGAGKTTTMRILAGETEPYGGTVSRSGLIGYLPQDSREGNIEQTARERVLSARGLDDIKRRMAKQQELMETATDEKFRDKAIRKYSRLEEQFDSLGGYEADSECAQICDNLGLPQRVLDQKLKTLSGGQRRRVELAQILFAASEGSGKSQTTLLLDEPTNHLDADSIVWLRQFLSKHEGGLVMISHDVELLEAVCNKVWFLDAVRGEADVYNMGYKKYLDARATDEARRRRERANAEKKASALQKQAAKLGAKATKAAAAKQMLNRAERMMNDLDEVRVADKVANIKFPEPAPCGKTPMNAKGLTKMYGSLEVFAGVDLAIDKGSRVVVLGYNGAGKTTLLKLWRGRSAPMAKVASSVAMVCALATLRRSTTISTRIRAYGKTPSRPAPMRTSKSCAGCWERSCFPAINCNSPPERCPAVRKPACRWLRWSPAARTCCFWMSRPITSTPSLASRCLTRSIRTRARWSW